jgi:hypothetical protein
MKKKSAKNTDMEPKKATVIEKYPTLEEAGKLLREKIEVKEKGKKKKVYKINSVRVGDTFIAERVGEMPSIKDVLRFGGGRYVVKNMAPPEQAKRRP